MNKVFSPTSPAIRYRFTSLLLLPFWILHALWISIHSKQFEYLWKRLGFQKITPPVDIWIHASSVGEVELIKPLVNELHQNHRILVTSFTVTGLLHARRALPNSVQLQVLPIDFLIISRRFVKRISPRIGLIAETELWPETLYQCKSIGIPLLQINARLSSRTLDTPGWLKPILRTTLGYFDAHLTRHSQDHPLFQEMGVKADKLVTVGNLKYAQILVNEEYQDLIKRPYLLFASTHAPEELLFSQLINELKPDILTVIAPRHPNRAAEILGVLKPLNLEIRQRSLGQTITPSTRVYLADTLGEMKSLMAHAKLVVMGGSFNETGGHNVLEPASLEKAVITGPSDTNIRQDIELLLQKNGIIQVSGIDELKEQLPALLGDSQRLQDLGSNAVKCISQQQQILQRYLQQIKPYL